MRGGLAGVAPLDGERDTHAAGTINSNDVRGFTRRPCFAQYRLRGFFGWSFTAPNACFVGSATRPNVTEAPGAGRAGPPDLIRGRSVVRVAMSTTDVEETMVVSAARRSSPCRLVPVPELLHADATRSATQRRAPSSPPSTLLCPSGPVILPDATWRVSFDRLAGEPTTPEHGDREAEEREGHAASAVGQAFVEEHDAEHDAEHERRRVARRHGRASTPVFNAVLLEHEADERRDDQHVGRPCGEQRRDAVAELADEHLGDRGLQREADAGRRAEERSPSGAVPGRPMIATPATSATETTPAVHHAVADGFDVPPAGAPTARNTTMPAMTATAAVISRRPTCWSVRRTPSGSAITRLKRRDRLDDEQRTAIERRGLQHPARRLHRPAREPDGLAQDLHEEPRVPAAGASQRAPLLQHCAGRERDRREEGERDRHERGLLAGNELLDAWKWKPLVLSRARIVPSRTRGRCGTRPWRSPGRPAPTHWYTV